MTEASGGTAGRVVNGRYRLGESLGRGGMGTVWRAVDELLRREVAVKEVRIPDDLDEGERDVRRERAMREARAAARVVHPNVVTIYDVVEDGGRPWIVMELVRAKSLDDVIGQEGRLGPAEAADIGLKVVAALRAARAADVLHRDVKPSNILMGEGGRVVLTDFGIATVLGSATLTATGMLIGSPEYLAPERVLGRSPGPASDLWSLGVTLYQALEGRSPFQRGSAIETLTAVLQDEPEPTRYAGPLGPAIEALLRKEPDDRPDEEATELLLGAALKGKQYGTGQAPTALAAGAAAAGSTPGSGPGSTPGSGPVPGSLTASAMQPPIPGPPSGPVGSSDSQWTVEDPYGPHGPTVGPAQAAQRRPAQGYGASAAAGAGGAAAGYAASHEQGGEWSGSQTEWPGAAHGQAEETRTAGAGHPRSGDTPPPFPVGGFHGMGGDSGSGGMAGQGFDRGPDTPGPRGTRSLVGDAYPPRRRPKGMYAVLAGLVAAAVATAFWVIPAALGDQGGEKPPANPGVTGTASSDPAGGAGGGATSSAPETTQAPTETEDTDTPTSTPPTTKRTTTKPPTTTTTRPTTTTTRPTTTTTRPTTTRPTTTGPTTHQPTTATATGGAEAGSAGGN